MKTIFDDVLREDVISKFQELDELATEYISENPKAAEYKYLDMREVFSGMCILFVMIMRANGNVTNGRYYMMKLMIATEPVQGGYSPLKYVITDINTSDRFGNTGEDFNQLMLTSDDPGLYGYYYCYGNAMDLIMDGTWDREQYEYLREYVLWNIDRLESDEERYELYGAMNLFDGRQPAGRMQDEDDYDNDDERDYNDMAEYYARRMTDDCEEFLKNYPTPASIKTYLDKYVIGQDDAKKLISLSVFQHYNRILHEDAGISKFNVLMIGPSGCGKTEIIRRLKEIVNLPIITADFSGIVSTPYKGRNKEDELIRLYKEAGENIYRAERGIIFLDEFDKVCKPGDVTRGYSNSDELMGQLLSMMEGSVIDTSQRSHVDKYDDDIMIDTKNILFVCLGAFDGLDEIILHDSKRLESERSESGGFGMTPTRSSERITSEDVEVRHLIQYGIKPELAGRLCNLAVLNPIDKDMMMRILTEAEDSAIRLFQKELLLDDGIELKFTDEALEAIAEKALERGVGARAVNSVVRESLTDIMFEAPSMKEGTVITVTGEMVNAG